MLFFKTVTSVSDSLVKNLSDLEALAEKHKERSEHFAQIATAHRQEYARATKIAKKLENILGD